jgi:hypothetical protein
MCEKCDPIVREVRKFREEHAKKFNYNLRSIYEDLIEQERLSGRWFITYASEGYKQVEMHKHNLPGDDEVLYDVNSKYFVRQTRDIVDKGRNTPI